MRRMLLLLAWTACLAAALAGALRLGEVGALAAPPVEPSSWAAWLEERSAADAAVALLRLVVVALCLYLLLATVLALLAGPLLPTPAFVRSIVGAAAIGVFTVAPAAASVPSRSPPELRLLDPPVAVPAPSPPPPAASTPSTPTWVVQPGDHLWSIAERSAPGDVTRYWVALVEANRDQLPDPDVVLPGQVVVLPDYGPGP